MIGFRRWLGSGVMLVGALQASAAIQPMAANRATAITAAAGTGSHLAVFGVPKAASSSSVTVKAGKLDGSLTAIAQSYPSIASSSSSPLASLHTLNPAARFRISSPSTTPEVALDAIAEGDPQALKASLAALGMRDIAVFSNDVGGWLPVDQLATASAVTGLHFARAAMPRTRSSMVATQGDFVQQSSNVRSTYPGLTGAGVTVGVLSDSFNCFAQYAANSSVPVSGYQGYAPFGFTATYADDQTPSAGEAASTAALPAGVDVLEEADCLDYGAPEQLPFTDEGRAILQIVHAVAPGAGLSFYTAVNTEADFANGIVALAKAGAKVIDDDVGYPDEPFFQDGEVAQAIINVATNYGVAYFSSAGNDGQLAYENTAPSFPVAGTGSQAGEKLLNFDTSGATTTTALPLTIPSLFPGEFIFLVVEWDQPYYTGSTTSGGSTSSFDICVQGNTSDFVTTETATGSVTCTGGSSLGGDPVQIIIIGNPANASGYSPQEDITITVGLVNGGTVPGRVKFALEDDGAGSTINQFFTGSPTIQGHPGSASAAAVGAAFYFQTALCGTTPALLESYSSEGGDPILFDTSGNRLTTPVIRNKPDFVAPDGVNNTMLGATLNDETSSTLIDQVNATTIEGCMDNESFPNFFGTSAAAPHAAGAAALMLQANSSLTPTDIIGYLQSSAILMTSAAVSPYDYNNGHGFLDINAAFAMVPAAAAPSISVSPTSITVGSSATLTWNALDMTGCTASGSWSGSEAASGTQTVTPSGTGMDTYTLTCTSAGTSVSASATLNVTAASSSSSSGGHGGAIDLTTLLALGGVLLAGRALRRRSLNG